MNFPLPGLACCCHNYPDAKRKILEQQEPIDFPEIIESIASYLVVCIFKTRAIFET